MVESLLALFLARTYKCAFLTVLVMLGNGAVQAQSDSSTELSKSARFYEILSSRPDVVAKMPLRSQKSIDEHTDYKAKGTFWPGKFSPKTSERVRYDKAEDAAHLSFPHDGYQQKVYLDLPALTSGSLVCIHEYKLDPSYFKYSKSVGGHKFGMLGKEGKGTRMRLEFRYAYQYSSEEKYFIDVRPYGVGQTIGAGAGADRLTPYTPAFVPTGKWVRYCQVVDFEKETYSLFVSWKDGNLAAYEDVPIAKLKENGGLNRWTPLWISASQLGEDVTMKNQGSTVVVTHVNHGLLQGDDIQLWNECNAQQEEYNKPTKISRVVDRDTYEFELGAIPMESPTPKGKRGFRMLAVRSHGWIRNCVALWSEKGIQLDQTWTQAGDTLD